MAGGVGRTLGVLALAPACFGLVRVQNERPSRIETPFVVPQEDPSKEVVGVGDAFANTRWHADILKRYEETGQLPVGWGDAVSGGGATWDAARPLGEFLPEFMAAHNVTSMVEASAGHWPSGWQRNVSWPPLRYIGVDIQPEVVQADRQLTANHTFGLASVDFKEWDMLRTPLPSADLLLVKDTLVHFPNDGIWQFLNLSVTVCPPLFRYVLFVNPAGQFGKHRSSSHKQHSNGKLNPITVCKDLLSCTYVNATKEIYGGVRNVDMDMEPFDKLPFETVLEYQPEFHKVQLIEPPTLCQ